MSSAVNQVLDKPHDDEFAFLMQPLRSISWDASYPDITDELQGILLPENGARLSRLKAQLAAKEEELRHDLVEAVNWSPECRAQAQSDLSHLAAMIGRCEDLHDLLQDLEAEVREPRYRRCFLVAGGPGAGKSYLIGSLLQERCGKGSPKEVLLPLEWDGQQSSLEPAILRGFEKVSGQSWRSLSI